MAHTINLTDLSDRLNQEKPDNTDRKHGYALVNVLPAEYYEKEHIPGSINIPYNTLEEFERRFDKEKELILYCASRTCNAAPKGVEQLIEKGFINVRDFAGGVQEWKAAGNQLNKAQTCSSECSVAA